MAENLFKKQLLSKPTLSSIFNMYVEENFKGLDWGLLGLRESGIIENMAISQDKDAQDLYSGFGRWK